MTSRLRVQRPHFALHLAPRVARVLPWPLPALGLWLVGWALHGLALRSGATPVQALLVAASLGGVAAAWGARRGLSVWRRLMLAGGLPVALLLTGALPALPAWLWLLPAALLLAVYPVRAWRDAPVFPTPTDALQGLAGLLALPANAAVLDAGCGLGHGLRALRREYPQARLQGIEWSSTLRLWAALRCPWAQVVRGDMWAQSWQGLALVYLFQRPETMPRAWAKAQAELAPGAWLASLEFPVPGVTPTAVLQREAAKPVWIYRMAAAPAAAAQVGKFGADMQIRPSPRQPQAPGRPPFKKRVSTCS